MMLDYTKYSDHKIKMAGSQVMKEYWWLIVILVILAAVIVLLGIAWTNLLQFGNCDVFLAMTAPTNNSIWELSKIVIYPMLIVFIIVYAAAHHTLRNPAVALLTATVTALLFIWFWIYVYSWFNLTRTTWWANLIIYILGIFVAMIPMFICFVAPYMGDGANYACIAIYLILIVLWSIFSYSPPCSNCGLWWHTNEPVCRGGSGSFPGSYSDGGNGGGNGGGQAQKDKVKKMKKEAMKKKEECGYNSDGNDHKKKHRKHHDGYDSSSS